MVFVYIIFICTIDGFILSISAEEALKFTRKYYLMERLSKFVKLWYLRFFSFWVPTMCQCQ